MESGSVESYPGAPTVVVDFAFFVAVTVTVLPTNVSVVVLLTVFVHLDFALTSAGPAKAAPMRATQAKAAAARMVSEMRRSEGVGSF